MESLYVDQAPLSMAPAMGVLDVYSLNPLKEPDFLHPSNVIAGNRELTQYVSNT